MGLRTSRHERKYQEALLLLGERFKVGQPYRDEQGRRVCVIGNTLLGFDYDVFMLVWGKAIAEELISAHQTANAIKIVA
jgi:hypothetical protein